MTLFKQAKIESAYLKMGIYGDNGSGKTRTASEVAIGLFKHIKAEKPIFFGDSETGSDFVIPIFKKHEIPLAVAKTRSYADLLEMVKEAEKEASILIVDSITHFWDDLVEGFKKSKGIQRIFVQHWMEIKPEWRIFSERFITSNLHFIVCGRAGDVWQDVQDEEGFSELKKVGTKMRVEKELGYEPSLLIEMEKARLKPNIGDGWIHRAWVVKDRFDVIDSKNFDNPTFESFLPHIELLNIGGEHRALDPKSETKNLFQSSGNGYQKKIEKDILLEKILAEVKLSFPSKKEDDIAGRSDLMFQVFNTRSWTEIEKWKSIDELQQGLDRLMEFNKPEEKEKKA